MTRLRLCSHSLEIETGRWDRPETDRKDRHCFYCKTHGKHEVEDEGHFLIICPLYRDLRETLLPQNILHDNSLRIEDKVTQILSDIENVKSVAKFIYQAFEDRKISLEVLSFINSMTDYVDKYIADASNPQKNSYVVKNSSEDGLKITFSREKKSSYVVQSSTEDGLKIILSRISS